MDNILENQLSEFVDYLLDEKNLKIADPDIMSEIKLDLLNETQSAIEQEVLMAMTEDQLSEYAEIAEDQGAEAAANYIKEKVPNYIELVNGAMLQVRLAYLKK